MANEAIRAFSNPIYAYYKLKQDFGPLSAGAIFWHDKEDTIYGSLAEGCLKLCWTAAGDCFSGLCGGAVILNAKFKDGDIFERVYWSEYFPL